MDRLKQDLRYGFRMLAKKPLFTSVVILSLALCIGANTAVFSIVNAVLLRPFPHVSTDSWVYVWEKPQLEGISQVSASIPNYRDWKAQNKSFSDMVIWRPYNYSLSGSGTGAPEIVTAAVATPDVFTALNLLPAAGRMLSDSDSKSSQYIAVISYALWKRRFGGDPNLVGKTINLNLVPHLVVGVAPPDFSFPPEIKTDIWTLYPESAINADVDRAGRGYRVAAKLKPGVTVKQAQAEMDLIASTLAEQYPEDKGFGVKLEPMREAVSGSFQTPLLTLAGALAFVLLLTCTNIANLQLVRLEGRRKELALRTALGADQTVLISQILTEILILVIAAGILGIMLAPAGVRLLLSFVPTDADSWLTIEIDKAVLLVSLAITLLTALISGLLPAIKISRASLKNSLSAGWGAIGSGPTSSRLRSTFLVAQLALAVIPLTGAGLLVSSLMNLEKVDPGFQSDHRLTMSFYAPRARYKDHDKLALLAEQVSEQVRQIPGVKNAGVAQYLPFSMSLSWVQAISKSDPKQIPNLAELPHIRYAPASTGYFEAMGIRLKSGRTFQQSDDGSGAQVTVINDALAKKYFPGEDPIGKQVWLGHAQLLPQLPARTIVGVVNDTVITSLDESPRTAAWVPISQQTFFEDVWRSQYLVIHTSGEPDSITSAVRERISKVDPDLALADVATMEVRTGQSLWRNRLTAVTMASLGVIALFIAMLGVFGVTSYLVTERNHEIGVRIAVGAQNHHIYRLIMGEGLLLILAGIAIGIGGSLMVTRWLQSLLYGVGAKDPITFVVVSLLLIGVGLLACYIPARRATRVDPLITLRTE